MSLDNFLPQNQAWQKNIRLEVYPQVIVKYKKQYPKAIFEVIMRFPPQYLECSPHILSPSIGLFKQARAGQISWDQYSLAFEKEMFGSHQCIQELFRLKAIAQNNLLFLICSEKNPAHCHRSLIKHYLLHLEEFCAKYQ